MRPWAEKQGPVFLARPPRIVQQQTVAGVPGGAIYCTNATLRATRCLLSGNSAIGGNGVQGDTYTGSGGDALGGAVECSDSTVILTSVTFSNNVARAGQMSPGRPAGGVVAPTVARSLTLRALRSATALDNEVSGLLGCILHCQ